MVRFRVILAAAIVLISSQVNAYARDSDVGYPAAAPQFEALPIKLRIALQLWLTSAGYWNAVPNANFSGRLYHAFQRFQDENGYQATGTLSKDEVLRLVNLAAPNLMMWGFRKVNHIETTRCGYHSGLA